MQQKEYRFRWLNDKDPLIVDVEKTIYAPDLPEAKRQVKEEWPELDPNGAEVIRCRKDCPLPTNKRIKGNGESDLPLPGA